MSNCQSWKNISGENNWDGLLDPLDIDLRRFIIHCGERTQVIGDAFNGNKLSKWYGFSRYAPERLFAEVGLQIGNPYKYTVTNFFYARSESADEEESAWMGYVAVATDEGTAVLGRRDILVCWRGTELGVEWGKDFDHWKTTASDILGHHNYNHDHPNVHKGFKSIYTTSNPISPYTKASARDQVLSAVKKLVDKYEDEEISITVTGHSLGAALATLNATDIVYQGCNKPTNQPHKACLVTAIAIASPRVGDHGFKKVVSGLPNLRVLRVKNAEDPVPDLPPEIPIVGDMLPFGYTDVGEELVIDTKMSPYLKSGINPHNAELYLHGVAGTQGTEEFKLVVNRDISLVNKELDGLKDKYKVPVKWWIVKNKAMVQQEDGSWYKAMIQQEDGSWKFEDYCPVPPSVEIKPYLF